MYKFEDASFLCENELEFKEREFYTTLVADVIQVSKHCFWWSIEPKCKKNDCIFICNFSFRWPLELGSHSEYSLSRNHFQVRCWAGVKWHDIALVKGECVDVSTRATRSVSQECQTFGQQATTSPPEGSIRLLTAIYPKSNGYSSFVHWGSHCFCRTLEE